ncbi:hypothetical protein BFP97_05505 [Roseivirga sp. 4D4]|uniref:site-2 protease family protein n=1 Tax=Roseivirga sp. 4D4 TaxID=1889784 RepID=UPI00085301D8|nr:site-2 protease family protein [Roseivirga sp. 4D4]OEK00999.1 hypothetical protein BFP97_05505 [Roseivirga sp. 4D4]
MKGSLFLGQFAQIKVYVHWTFFILFAFIIYSGVSAGQSVDAIAWHLLFLITIFGCVILHEFGHALTGRRYGFKTKDIILLPIGGLARFEKLPENPIQEFVVAIAGPMVNFAIAFVLYFITQPSAHMILNLDLSSINQENFVTLIWIVNLSLGLFNLIPAFPMDGGRIFRAILSMFQPREKATKNAARLGLLLALGFIVLGLYYNPFLIFIGGFIILSASSESSIVSAQALLEGHKAGDIVMHNFSSLNHDLSIAQASEAVLDRQSTHFVIYSDSKEVVGTVNRDQIIKSLKVMDHKTTLSSIMNPVLEHIPAETSLKELYTSQILRNNVMVPVTENGEVVGVINLENILEFLAIKQATPQWKSILQRHKPT